MSSEIAIRVRGLGKCYEIYDKPRHRLWQMLSREVRKFYREFWALKDVSFEIKKGDTVGIIGRNGSGKSTLLQMLCGTLNPSQGDIEINGKVAALLELGAGFNPEFTGRENIFLSASLYGLTNEEIKSKFDQIIEFADIGNFVDQPVKTYSSGMYVRLAFALIAHVDADILVIDEALAVGDVYFVQKCMRFLRKFSEDGTLLFVSHDTNSILGLCSKAILLRDGRVERIGEPKDVSDYYLSINQDAENKLAHLPGVANNDFGAGLIRIAHVDFQDAFGVSNKNTKGDEYVALTVTCIPKSQMDNIIVGFLVRDRLGQIIFGENTCSRFGDEGISVDSNQVVTIKFDFKMPTLQAGKYGITVAVAQGTYLEHLQHHWIHDAAIIEAQKTREYSGIISVPMSNIHVLINAK